MKLIEKLQLEHNLKDMCCMCEDDHKMAFEAGFRKAREMAAAIEWRGSANSEQWHELTQLGEEEVE